MTPQKSIPTTLEGINDELTSIQSDMDHKCHSAMEHFDLLIHMTKRKSEKAKLEALLNKVAPTYLYIL
jgi:hypothetical protein